MGRAEAVIDDAKVRMPTVRWRTKARSISITSGLRDSRFGILSAFAFRISGFIRHCLTLAALLPFGYLGVAQNLEWHPGPGYRWGEVPKIPSSGPGFRLLPSERTGVGFTNYLAVERFKTNQILLNGSGVALGDIDDDGWCDLYFCHADGPNALYRNLGGWRFEDITISAGVGCEGMSSTATVLADLDGDRDLDLLVNTIQNGQRLFRNEGGGRFTDVTPGSGLLPTQGGMSMAAGDIERDGDLDIYVANYRSSALMDIPNAHANFGIINGKTAITHFNGKPISSPELRNRFYIDARGGLGERGEADVLYRNQGNLRFEAISFTDGTFLDEAGQPLSKTPLEWGLSVVFRDVNADGNPDLYVCNDFDSPDRLWINQGDGRFRALPKLAMRQSSWFSMGVDFADIDRNGHDDFVVLDMLARQHMIRMNQLGDVKPLTGLLGEIEGRPQHMKTTLFANRGDLTFAELGQFAGVAASDWAWCAAFMDVDLDGWEDLLITNGHERDGRNIDVANELKALRKAGPLSDREIFDLRMKFPRFNSPNLAYRNTHDLRFEETSAAWGFDYDGVSHGMAFADLDHDGDQDVVVNHLNAAAGIYENLTSASRIAVSLIGEPPNTHGIGARITIAGGPVVQTQEIMSGGRYLSSDDAMRTFAAGNPQAALEIEVAWPSGKRSLISGASADRIYEVNETGATEVTPRPSPLASRPLFEDLSDLVSFQHRDDSFDDLSRQPMLIRRYSQLGPGVSWFDLNEDGWEDLIVASGRGGKLGVFLNEGGKQFNALVNPPFHLPVTRDQTTVLGWSRGNADPVILAGSSNYEDGLALGAMVRQYEIAGRRINDEISAMPASAGPMAMADVDADGDLDLFIGGRIIPGRYPEPASSQLLRQENNRFVSKPSDQQAFQGIGMVSGAVFTDLDGDGLAELVLACEWGPLRILKNRNGRFIDQTIEFGMDQYRGWWNGLSAGDFDGDGDMDLVAGNWGRNTRYENYRSQPLKLYYGDWDRNEAIDLIQAQFDQGVMSYVPQRQLGSLAKSLPLLQNHYRTYTSFASASMEQIASRCLIDSKVLNANWLESTVFLNQGTSFDPLPLPDEAQWAPAFGIAVGDFNGDRKEDLILSQNFFSVQPETARYDGGRGLLLHGIGSGGFQPVDGSRSGIKVYGEQRGIATCDFDNDRRLDFVVAQNKNQVKLYRNLSSEPGLRIRLEGPQYNRYAIGAQIRLKYHDGFGPIRELHCGSGYWSQDAAVTVLSATDSPTAVWIRWPGGNVTESKLPQEALEVTIDSNGSITSQ